MGAVGTNQWSREWSRIMGVFARIITCGEGQEGGQKGCESEGRQVGCVIERGEKRRDAEKKNGRMRDPLSRS